MFSAFSFLSLINTCKPGTDFFKCLCCKLNIHVDVHTHRRFQTVCPDLKKKSMWTTHLLTFATIFTQRSPYQDFLGGSVVKTPHFHCRGSGFHPGPETSILHAVQPKSFKKEEASASVTIHLTTPKQKLRNYPCLFPLAAINFSKFCGFSFITNSQNHLLHTLPNNRHSITSQHHPSLWNGISFLSISPSRHQFTQGMVKIFKNV